MSEQRRVLIVGCGYVGRAVAAELSAAGHTVFGLRRTPEPSPDPSLPYTPLVGDLTRVETLRALPGPWDWVVNTVSSSRGGEEEYRQVYLEGTRQLIEWLRPNPPRAYVYTSSTSVYGQTDGGWVEESAETQPGTATGRLLVDTERLLLEAAEKWRFPARVLRVAGIYGPGRGHLFHQFLRGEARVQGDGSRWMNMIHRDDVARAIVAVLERGRDGVVYNVADLEPVTQGDFLRWLAEQTGRSMPPPAGPGEAGPRKRGVTHKRVSVQRLRQETAWEPRYPSFREGYAAELAAVGAVSPGAG